MAISVSLGGELLLQIKDAKTGAIKREYRATNQYQDRLYADIATTGGGLGSLDDISILRSTVFADKRIFLSTEATLLARSATQITGVLAIGSDSPIYTTPYPVLKGANPPYVEIRNRVGFTGVERSFESGGLTSGAANDDLASTTEEAFSHLLLPATVTQAANEVVDLFYRITLRYD